MRRFLFHIYIFDSSVKKYTLRNLCHCFPFLKKNELPYDYYARLEEL